MRTGKKDSLHAAHDRVRALVTRNPEWSAWLHLVELTLDECDEPVWQAAQAIDAVGRPADAPLLAGATASIDARHTASWLRRLFTEAAQTSDDPNSCFSNFDYKQDPLALLAAAAAQDHLQIAEIFRAHTEQELHAVLSVAQLAVTPFLRSCQRQLGDRVSRQWSNGYCPICGAWPAFAEMRGLDRARCLRCARCASDWPFPVLLCAFCGERDHRKLASLVPDSEQQVHRVDTCKTCKGYLKSTTTLQATPDWAVMLEDIATVELDVAALDQGWVRPEQPGFPIELWPTARQAGVLAWFGGRA